MRTVHESVTRTAERSRIRQRADELTSDLVSNAEKTAAILAWVQNEISVNPALSRTSLENVLRTGRGTLHEAGVLCHMLLNSARVPNELVLTRPRIFGGFDTGFPTTSALMTPVLVLRTDSTQSLAFPYYVGYPAGEYPLELMGLEGLWLKSGRVRKLPPPRSDVRAITRRVRLHLTADSAAHELHLTYDGLSRCEMRRMVRGRDDETVRELLTEQLHKLDESNELISYEIFDMDEYDKPLRAVVHFRNRSPFLDVDNKRVLRFSRFCRPALEWLDTARTQDVVVYMRTKKTDIVEIVGHEGARITVEPNLGEAANDLFTVTSHYEHTQQAHVLTRTVELNETRLPARHIGSVMSDVEAANVFATSVVTLEKM